MKGKPDLDGILIQDEFEIKTENTYEFRSCYIYPSVQWRNIASLWIAVQIIVYPLPELKINVFINTSLRSIRYVLRLTYTEYVGIFDQNLTNIKGEF